MTKRSQVKNHETRFFNVHGFGFALWSESTTFTESMFTTTRDLSRLPWYIFHTTFVSTWKQNKHSRPPLNPDTWLKRISGQKPWDSFFLHGFGFSMFMVLVLPCDRSPPLSLNQCLQQRMICHGNLGTFFHTTFVSTWKQNKHSRPPLNPDTWLKRISGQKPWDSFFQCSWFWFCPVIGVHHFHWINVYNNAWFVTVTLVHFFTRHLLVRWNKTNSNPSESQNLLKRISGQKPWDSFFLHGFGFSMWFWFCQ